MKTELVKNENQVLLFDLIQKVLPTNLAMVDAISDLLNISTDAAYRRIRGVKMLDFEEAVLLCNHFKISLDTFVNLSHKEQIHFRFTPLVNNMQNQVVYLQNLLDDIDSVRIAEGEMIISAANLPDFNYFSYRELILFVLFVWDSSVYGFTGSFDKFTKNVDFNILLDYYDKIVKSYQLVPSTEIWTTDTIDRLLTLLNHHYEMGHFNDEKFPLLLCEQILDLINMLQNWAEKGSKGPHNTPYKLYVSEIDINNSFVMIKKENTAKCLVKLFTVNGLSTTDERFCQEIENWLDNTKQRATLISGASEKERHRFFNSLKQKSKC